MYLTKNLFLVTLTVLISMRVYGGGDESNTYLPTVKNVSLSRYIGKWFAITALPQRFTKRCVAQEAIYSLKSNTEIGVQNICTRKSGRKTDIKGFAKATNLPGVFDLKFTTGFAGFFGAQADYNIIALDPEYKYALIGGQDRKSLWLLSRTKFVSNGVYNYYLSRAQELGFDISKVVDSNFSTK